MNACGALQVGRVSRRSFVAAAGALSIAVSFGDPVLANARDGGSEAALKPNGWVRIDADGRVTIQSAPAEMGQGIMTALPACLAEELDADWSKVRIVPAPPIDAIYGNPGFGGMMYTAGSNAVRSYYAPLRMFGAQVRRVLIDNAAK